ncbi:MAG: hydrogenase maturation nickel metallochaperone HypA [Bacilli bacterium]|nr:hydrogenase maturation nickel metallochaperone HypA [Bacilli bacterium]
MHELGIVFYIIRNLKEISEKYNVSAIKKVTLEIGEVSTIIPSYLIDCYKWAIKKEDLLKDSSLDIEVIEAINHCNSCGMDYSATKFGKTCPNCKSKDTYLLKGNEANIKSIEY